MNRTERLMAILLELQVRGRLRAADLADRFEVSIRTIYRDLEGLSEGGVPLIATPGQGYRLVEGYFLPPLSFSGPEAGLLVLGGEFVRDRVDPDLREAANNALHKLESVLPADQRERLEHWRGELLFPRSRRADNANLGAIRMAIEERRVLRLLYHAYRRPGPEQRDVEPVSLIFMADSWHLAAYCRARQAPRFFRLDRIDHLATLSERFTVGERHTVPPRNEDWRAEAPEVRVRFDPDIERWVRERQLFTFVREEAHLFGTVFVYALRDEDMLLSWLLGWGTRVEVLEPRDIRHSLAERAYAIWARHAGTGPFDTDRALSGVGAHAGRYDQRSHLRHRHD
jgi:predicted DNA-binding transcriptional regulator YafY